MITERLIRAAFSFAARSSVNLKIPASASVLLKFCVGTPSINRVDPGCVEQLPRRTLRAQKLLELDHQ